MIAGDGVNAHEAPGGIAIGTAGVVGIENADTIGAMMIAIIEVTAVTSAGQDLDQPTGIESVVEGHARDRGAESEATGIGMKDDEMTARADPEMRILAIPEIEFMNSIMKSKPRSQALPDCNTQIHTSNSIYATVLYKNHLQLTVRHGLPSR